MVSSRDDLSVASRRRLASHVGGDFGRYISKGKKDLVSFNFHLNRIAAFFRSSRFIVIRQSRIGWVWMSRVQVILTVGGGWLRGVV